MSAINEIASLWMEGTMRTLDAFRTGFGATMDDPPPATRSRVIYESGLVRLRHYEARGENQKRVPLLLIYSLIKRPFILDLQPGRSVVEYLVKQGFDVYLIDWIPPRSDDRNHGFNEYVNVEIANAVRAIQIYTGIEQISILGYCFGALLGLIYSALHSGNVKNLVTLTIPLDTSVRQLPIEHLTAAMTSRSAKDDRRPVRQRAGLDDLLVLQHARAHPSHARQVRRRVSQLGAPRLPRHVQTVRAMAP